MSDSGAAPVVPSRRRHLRGWIIIVCTLGLLVILDQRGWLLVRRDDDMTRYHGRTALVVAVIDGDTIDIDLDDPLGRRSRTRVRLWGVDCPEPAAAGHAQQAWSDEATQFTLDAIDGRAVTLSLEPHRTRGVYGRVLAFVRTSDGSWIGEGLLRAGLARADERWPHARVREFGRLQEQARQGGAGVWSEP
jgi:endonuclease YncB( thermonuclease family)